MRQKRIIKKKAIIQWGRECFLSQRDRLTNDQSEEIQNTPYSNLQVHGSKMLFLVLPYFPLPLHHYLI